jgi:hypothetical protein
MMLRVLVLIAAMTTSAAADPIARDRVARAWISAMSAGDIARLGELSTPRFVVNVVGLEEKCAGRRTMRSRRDVKRMLACVRPLAPQRDPEPEEKGEHVRFTWFRGARDLVEVRIAFRRDKVVEVGIVVWAVPGM